MQEKLPNISANFLREKVPLLKAWGGGYPLNRLFCGCNVLSTFNVLGIRVVCTCTIVSTCNVPVAYDIHIWRYISLPFYICFEAVWIYGKGAWTEMLILEIWWSILQWGKGGETNSCQFFSITLQTITLNPNTYIIDHHQHESDTVSKERHH